MKKILKHLFLLVLCGLNLQTAFGQGNDVIVTVQVSPPYSPYLSTYVDQPNKILLTLTNISQAAQDLKLSVKITGDNGVSLTTSANFRPSLAIHLDPAGSAGAFKQIDFHSEETRDYFDANNVQLTGLSKAQLIQNQALPEGNYTVCVKALNYADNEPRSTDGCALLPVSYIDPPAIIQPQCAGEVAQANPQFILFTWTPPATASDNIQYGFTLKEVPNSMNPYDVMKNSTFPVLYNTTQTANNTLVYSVSFPQLDEGKKYAWQVKAIDPNNSVQFKNSGLSEVCWFNYVKGQPVNANQTPQITIANTDIRLALPSTTIKGKLQWSFRKTEEKGDPILPIYTAPVNVDNEVTLADIPNGIEKTYSPASALIMNHSEYQSNAGQVAGTGSTTQHTAPSSGNYFYQGGFSAVIPPALGIAQHLTPFEVTQGKIDAIAGSNKYPLTYMQVKVMLYPKAEVVKQGQTGMFNPFGGSGSFGAPSASPIEIGTAYTDNDGNFSVTYYSDIAVNLYDLHLEIDTRDFIFSDIQIPFEKTEDGVYSLGTLNGIAKTFRLQLKNYEYNYDKAKGYFVKGAPLKGVAVKVTHDPSDWSYLWHPNLSREGTRMGDGLDNDLANVQVATGKDDYQIPRIFPNHYTGGYVLVDAQLANFYSLKVGLNINESNHPEMFNNYLDKDVPVYVFENKMTGKDPVVKGKVLVEGTNAPVKGASVMIAKPEGGWLGGVVKIATTNDQGEFEIDDITPRDKPYNLLVSSGNINTYKEEINLNKTAVVIERTILVSGKLCAITGTVKDEKGNVLKDALVVWKTGGTPVMTNDDGRFVLSNIKGKHILVSKKPGFKDTELEVEVKEAPKGTTYSVQDIYNNATHTTVANTGGNQGLQNMINHVYGGSGAGTSFINAYGNVTNADPPPSGSPSAGSIYYAGSLFQQSGGFSSCFNSMADPVDIGDVIMKRFYLKVTVKDAVSSNPVKGAKVEFNGEQVGVTNASGFLVLDNVTSNTDNGLVVYGPDGMLYIPTANNIVLDAAKDTSEMTVQIKQGLKLTGNVSVAGAGIKDAVVYVEGSDYIKAKTDSIGNYTLAVPAGNKTLWAAKSGYIGVKNTDFFSTGSYVMNFALKEAGFDASKLLGFDIMLTESIDKGTNQFEITGSFVNIPSNTLFKPAANFKIPFHGQRVRKVGTGIVPLTGEIVTDISEIPLTLWDYLHLNLREPTGIKVVQQLADTSMGKIAGTMEVDVTGTFSGLTGIQIPSSSLRLAYGTGITMPAFTSDGSIPFTDSKVKIASTTEKLKVYDLTLALDFDNTYISKEGLDIAGSISCDGFNFLPALSMKLEQMRISQTGDIKNLKISITPTPKVSIGTFDLSMDHIDIGTTGLKLGGNVKATFPGSTVSLGFSNLNVTKGSLSGGVFTLSGTGLDLFGILKVGPGASTGLTLTILPNGKDFNLTGNVNFNFKKYFNKEVRIDEFGITSNGNFSAKINSTVSVDVFSFAGFDITTLGVNTANSQVDLGGKIKFAVPGFGAGVGTTMHYKPSGATFDDFNIDLSLGGIGQFSAKAAFSPSEEKFAGQGHVKIESSPLDFTAGFFYNKGSFGANFNMGPAVVLPIGPLSLDKIGGGFTYDKPASKFSVYGQCRIKFSPDPYGAVELDPTKFGITVGAGGPIFTSSCVGKIVKIPFANANFVMDIPARKGTLDATAGGSFKLIPGINAGANFALNAEVGFGSDPYLFFGQAMDISVPFLCNSSGGMAVAVNYVVSDERGATYHLTPGEKFTGVSAWSVANIGRPESNPWGFDVGIGSVALWCGNQSEVKFHVKLNGFDAGFGIAGGWSAGAKACLKWLGCAGIGASAGGDFNGNMDSDGVQSASANLSASAQGSFGCCNGNCGNGICTKWYVPCGAKACVSAGIGVSYTKGSGFSFTK